MDLSGSFAFSISDLKLDFCELESEILIEPTKIIRRGQMVGKFKNIEAPYDVWLYEISITDNNDIFSQLSLMLDNLLPYKKYIYEASKQYEKVIISCYLRSDFGQIGFQLNNDIIFKLASFGLSIDFHILSFGSVKN
ncbi:DUF4279 domain-containing protein [Desulfosporosinus sp. PR]|uniref:DUF4279 domain-containing protein n=1 Tax=Candidatus Desulfosporosinus nitrosoreducens TaxID=3401928 RepID=UPI0027E8202E|nr:DUF4279 domain-containing protein [Desulfosporosinus sp. PR]MDQ7095869.1 DUF4279 domain-containing protein [Desulfosporosinus sp. PR]